MLRNILTQPCLPFTTLVLPRRWWVHRKKIQVKSFVWRERWNIFCTFLSFNNHNSFWSFYKTNSINSALFPYKYPHPRPFRLSFQKYQSRSIFITSYFLLFRSLIFRVSNHAQDSILLSWISSNYHFNFY